MENSEANAPEEGKSGHYLRQAGLLLVWAVYGIWLGLCWLFEGRRSLLWLACFLIGGWYGWEHRYEIAEEWGRLRGRYQGSMELERERAKRGIEDLKALKRD